MTRTKEIQKALHTLVGWEQHWDLDKAIRTPLLRSESGLYFNQAHPLLTLDNVRSILPDQSQMTIEEWDNETPYKVGKVVSLDGTQYICRIANTGNNPSSTDFNDDYNEDYGNAYWSVYDQLSEYLDKAIDSGITAMVANFTAKKTLNKESKSLLDHKCLFDVTGRAANRIATTHCLVGYEITPLRGMGVTTQIHRIGLQMTGADGVVPVYLFHSSQTDPVATFNLRVQKKDTYQWFSLTDIFMRYMDGTTNAGGSWYLCYWQDEMPEGMEAVNIVRDWSKDPCQSCGGGDTMMWRTMTRYMRVSPFRVGVDDDFAVSPYLPEISSIVYTPNYCYGMNMEISIGCDVTDFIISQKMMFANVLQKQVAYDLLRTIAYNPDSVVNRNQLNVSRQDFLFELDGNSYTHSKGIRGELNTAYDALDLDTTNMDSACLACTKTGVKFKLA